MTDSPKASRIVRLAGCGFLLCACVWVLSQERAWSGVALGAAAIAAFWLACFALLDRPGSASAITAGAVAGLGAGSAAKLEWLQQPLLATDFTFFADHVSANFSILERYPKLAGAIAAGIASLAAAAWIAIRYETRTRFRAVPRSGGMLASVAVLALAMPHRGGQPADKLEQVLRPWHFYSGSGDVLSRFVLSFGRMRVAPPERSAIAPVPGLFDSEPSRTPPALPDIFLWHDESTFDPAMLRDCTAPECRVRMYEPDANTAAAGWLKVSTFGGLSSVAEFAVLTGMSHRVFGEGATFAHFTLAPRVRRTLPLQLKQYGYRTVALYPNRRHFLNAAYAYRHYGFDEFYDFADLGLPNDFWKITDRAMYEGMRKIVDKHRGGPILVYLLTQYQHGPHDQSLRRLPEPYRTLKLPASIPAKARVSLANYLYRLQLSEGVIADFERDVLRDLSRRRLFLHYGDHQPSLDGHLDSLAKQGLDAFPREMHAFLTKFILKTNFPAARKENHPFLDIAFLGSLALDVAGIPKDEYWSANSQMRTLCDGRYLECEQRDAVARYHDRVFHELRAFE